MEPVGVDPDAVANGLDLGVALDRAGEIELLVERDQRDFVLHHFEIPYRQRVVHSVHAHALPREPLCEPLARVVGEDLLLDPAAAVLPT